MTTWPVLVSDALIFAHHLPSAADDLAYRVWLILAALATAALPLLIDVVRLSVGVAVWLLVSQLLMPSERRAE